MFPAVITGHGKPHKGYYCKMDHGQDPDTKISSISGRSLLSIYGVNFFVNNHFLYLFFMKEVEEKEEEEGEKDYKDKKDKKGEKDKKIEEEKNEEQYEKEKKKEKTIVEEGEDK